VLLKLGWHRFMILERFHGLLLVRELVQSILVLISYVLWVVLFYIFYGSNKFDLNLYLRYGCFLLIFLLAQSLYWVNHNRMSLYRIGSVGKNAVFKFGWISFAILLFLAATKDQSVSRSFLFSWLIVVFVVLLINENWVLDRLFGASSFLNSNNVRAFVYGGAPENPEVRNWLMQCSQFGVELVGVITNSKIGWDSFGIPVVGAEDSFDELLDNHRIGLLVVVSDRYGKFNNVVINKCERRGIRFVVCFDYSIVKQYKHSVCPISRIPLLVSRSEPLQNPINMFLKRLLDILVSLCVVIIILPIMAFLVWGLHRIFSPGNLFYTQKRSGVGNAEFTILKFRTMHETNNRPDVQATINDGRVFTGGRLLRKMSIDELPQFINVLLGHMSVVGPRPHLWEHSLKWAEDMHQYHLRSLVKPGITGLAQIRGYRGEAKSENDIRLRVFSDIEYIEIWSIWLDFEIIAKTAFQVLFPPRTAY
jgi:putative colanic acid biosynthesis UDP-glucose lipid carrier transferase